MERRVTGPVSMDLSAVFWGLRAWTVISLVFAASMVFGAGVAEAQSGQSSNGLFTRVVEITNNEGVVDGRPVGRETGLPIPRFVSFRNAKTNMRVGPGIEFELRAIYNRKGLPVQVLAESGHWREVRDWEGTQGWVHKDLLSSRRMARIEQPWVNVLRQPSNDAKPVAELAFGVLAQIKSCAGDWCIVEINNVQGWLPRSHFFGTFSHEDFG